MELYKKYTTMPIVEFLEFIGRLAYLAFTDESELLHSKIYRLLALLLRLVDKEVDEAEDIFTCDSESDYEDDVAANYLQ